MVIKSLILLNLMIHLQYAITCPFPNCTKHEIQKQKIKQNYLNKYKFKIQILSEMVDISCLSWEDRWVFHEFHRISQVGHLKLSGYPSYMFNKYCSQNWLVIHKHHSMSKEWQASWKVMQCSTFLGRDAQFILYTRTFLASLRDSICFPFRICTQVEVRKDSDSFWGAKTAPNLWKT